MGEMGVGGVVEGVEEACVHGGVREGVHEVWWPSHRDPLSLVLHASVLEPDLLM